jgi:hypothetical protein
VPTIYRGPGATKAADALGATAFTRGGEVFVPRKVGPLDRPPGRAVVAHEVMHASQQRRSGSILPGEDTGAGAALESRAQAAERYFRGDPGAPRPGVDADAPTLGSSDASASRSLSQFPESTAGVQRRTAPASPQTEQTQRNQYNSPAPALDWNPIATFGHTLTTGLQDLGEEIGASEWSLSHEVRDDITRAANAAERDFAQNQYRQLRLEHRKTRFMAEHHQTALGPDDERHIADLVDADVTARLVALQERIERRLLSERDTNGQSPRVIDRDEFRSLAARLFGDASTDTVPPDDTGSAAASSGGRSSRGPGSGGHPRADGRRDATDRAVTADAGSAAVSDGAGTATGPADEIGGVAAAGGGRNVQPDGTGGRASFGRAQTPGGPGPTTRRDLTVGEGFRHLAADVVADAALLDAGEWGLHLSEQEWRQLRRDVHDPLASDPSPGGQRVVAGAGTSDGGTAARASSAPGTSAAGDVRAPGPVATAGHTTGAADTAHQGSAAGVYPIGAALAGQATAGPTGHQHLDLDHLDLDDLSDRLYGRLRRRLRTELLVDRERAGLLTDFR